MIDTNDREITVDNDILDKVPSVTPSPSVTQRARWDFILSPLFTYFYEDLTPRLLSILASMCLSVIQTFRERVDSNTESSHVCGPS